MGEMRKAYTILVRKPEGRIKLMTPGRIILKWNLNGV
jgi:hypothetical protein